MTELLDSKQTNEICDSQCVKQLDCEGHWSLVQYQSYAALSVKRGSHSIEFNRVALDRIKLISSLYAQLYLEQNDGGNPALKGRFYWAGLAAIAAKQVYCGVLAMQDVISKYGSHAAYLGGLLDKYAGMDIDGSWPTSLQNNSISKQEIEYMREKMLKGNLWLFLDIYPTHLYYRDRQNSFFSCLHQRNAKNYKAGVLDQLNKLPYISALPELNHFDYDDQHILKGFQFIQQAEKVQSLNKKQEFRLESLMSIAWHEQKIVLQACFYAPYNHIDPKLKLIFDKQKYLETHHPKVVDRMRLVADVQGRRAVLTNSCPVPRSITKSGLSKKEQERFFEDMKTEKDKEGAEDLYNLQHRMAFITRIADDYDYVMKTYDKKMEGYLALLASKNIGSTIWN